MLNSILKVELLKEGRSIRLPILIIFYNAILAFVTILFIFFNNESMQIGYYSGRASFLTQFLLISSFQIVAVIVLMPLFASTMEDEDRGVAEEIFMIPGVVSHYVMAKISTLVAVNMLLFLSGLPIISLSCIYSGISLLKLFRLSGMVLIFSFWSGSIAVFWFSVCKRQLFAFAGTFFNYILLSIGNLVFLEVVKTAYSSMVPMDKIPDGLRWLCLIINLLNPISIYLGYCGNISGGIGTVVSYFGKFGIDSTATRFSFLYYKAATCMGVLVGILFLALSVRLFSINKSNN